MDPEQPVYVLKRSKSRMIIPKAIALLALSIIFYFGVLLNISLLDLRAEQETLLKTVTLILLVIIIAAGILLSALNTKKPYLFYKNRISFGKKQIYYNDITNTAPHFDPIDRIFKTYSINLGNKFFLRHISQNISLENYLQQLIAYTRNR